MKTVEFLGFQATRVILGDNPFIGNSYIPDIYPRKEMFDYYQADKVLSAFFRAEECGINTYMCLADNYLIRLFQQYRRDGGKMNLMFQTHPATDLQANIYSMMDCEPIAIYHQGSTLDEFMRDGRKDYLLERIELIRSTGVYTGMASHIPETILLAEEENWGLDFYMTSIYNTQKNRENERSSFFTNQPKYLKFFPEDPPKMYKVIKQVNKPCIAFKIFAGGQVFNGKTAEEIPGVLESVYTEVFNNIKPNDLTCIGVYQKYKDEIKENVDIANKVLNK